MSKEVAAFCYQCAITYVRWRCEKVFIACVENGQVLGLTIAN